MATTPFDRVALTLTAVLLCASYASAASPMAEAQARFKTDMAVCNSGQSNQDATTCRREAQNALTEARRGGLTAAPGKYQANGMQRCMALKGDDRGDCESRVRGEGAASGSVASGGILRESVTVVPAK